MGEIDLNLVNYVYTYLKQNYSIYAIKQTLISQGYDEVKVNAAIDYVYANYYYKDNKNPVKKGYGSYKAKGAVSHFGIPDVAILIIAIFGVALIGLSLIFMLSTPSDIKMLPEEVISNSNLEDSVPVVENKNPITNSKDPVKVQEVQKSENENTKIELETPPKGGLEYTQNQLENNVEKLAESKPNEALLYCDKMRDIQRQYCYVDVAGASGIEIYCDDIETTSIKDSCFLELVLEENGDEQTCVKIVDENRKKGCMQIIKTKTRFAELEQIKDSINQTYVENESEYYQYVNPANFY